MAIKVIGGLFNSMQMVKSFITCEFVFIDMIGTKFANDCNTMISSD